jgi:hypothetical protein
MFTMLRIRALKGKREGAPVVVRVYVERCVLGARGNTNYTPLPHKCHPRILKAVRRRRKHRAPKTIKSFQQTPLRRCKGTFQAEWAGGLQGDLILTLNTCATLRLWGPGRPMHARNVIVCRECKMGTPL